MRGFLQGAECKLLVQHQGCGSTACVHRGAFLKGFVAFGKLCVQDTTGLLAANILAFRGCRAFISCVE